MAAWSPDTIAAVVAAAASAALFFADRVPHIWRALTARSRWLGAISASHPPTGKVLGELRATRHNPLGYLSSLAYTLPVLAFGAPELVPKWILPASADFSTSLLALSIYATVMVVVVDASFRSYILTKLQAADPVKEVPKEANRRYVLARDLSLGWIPALIGLTAGHLSTATSPGFGLSTSFLASLGFLAYLTYLAYSEYWSGTRRAEQTAFAKFVPAQGGFPACEVRLSRGIHRPSEEVVGLVVDVGASLRLVRLDGFAEEFDWGDVRRLAVKVTTPSPTSPRKANGEPS